MYKRKIIEGKDLIHVQNNIKKAIKNLIVQTHKSRLTLPLKSSVVPITYIDIFRTAAEYLDSHNMSLRNALLRELQILYTRYPSCVFLFLSLLNNEKIEKLNIGELETIIKTHKSRVSFEDVNNCMDYFIGDSDIRDQILNAFKVGGSSSSYQVQRSYLSFIKIEDGFKLSGAVDNFFIAKTGLSQNIFLSDVKIVPIDGQIINVADIHHLLTHANNTKENILLITRGFSKEVLNTLAINFLKGKLNIFPFSISNSLESINDIRDVCTFCNCLPVSQDKGDLLSDISLEDFSRLFNIDINMGHILIMGDDTSSLTAQKMIEDISKKIKEEKVRDKVEILRKRKLKISSRKTVIGIKKSEETFPLWKDRIRSFILFLRNISLEGSINKKHIFVMLKDYIDEEILEESSPNILPANGFLFAIKCAQSLSLKMNNIGAILELDGKENKKILETTRR